VPKPGTARAHDEPSVPKDFDESSLPVNVRAELKSLPKDLAATVGGHILAAGELLDVDPELAHRHAEAAKRRAGRLPVVREAAAEAAYVSGHYDIALREFRAIRRMSGGDELLPVLADCERALGRHREALELLATLDPRTKKFGLRIECILVEAGIRADLGQRGEALRLLKSAISHRIGPRPAQARLHYAYADLLEAEGRSDAAREWFESAASLDLDGRLDATDRIAALDGITLPEDFETEDPAEKTDPEDEMETQVIDVTAPPAGAVVKRVAPGGRQDEAEEEGAPHRTPAADDAAGTVPARRESAVPYQRDLLISPEEEIAEILSEIDGDGR
jgi:tetratricopeptide TPR_4